MPWRKYCLRALFGPGIVLTLFAASAFSQIFSRYNHISVLLPNNNILVAGGVISYSGAFGTATNEAELQLPNGTFTTAASMQSARAQASATMLPDGTILVAGGYNGSTILSSAEIYNPALNTWTPVASAMSALRYGHTATLLQSGKVLLCGGFSDTNYTANGTCDIYDPNTQTFTGGITLEVPRGYHTATLLQNGTVFLTGGYNPAETPPYLVTSELYTPGSPSLSSAHALNDERYGHTATLMGNGKVLIVGGYNDFNINDSTGYLASVELYDPVHDSMQVQSPMEERKMFQSATLKPDGTINLFGGLGNITDTYLVPQTAVFNSGSYLNGSDSLFTGQTDQIVNPSSASVPLSIQLSVQATGVIQSGEIIISTPSATFTDGQAFWTPSSSSPLNGVYINLAGTQVTCNTQGTTCGLINGNLFLQNLNQGTYTLTPISVTPANMTIVSGNGSVSFNAQDAVTAGTLVGTTNILLPAEFIGYHIPSGAITLSAGSVTDNSGNSLTITAATGSIPSGTSIIADPGGSGMGYASFSITFNLVEGNVSFSASGVSSPQNIPGGTFTAPTILTGMTGTANLVVDGLNLSGQTFSMGISTVIINSMFFGDMECYNPSQNSWSLSCNPNRATALPARDRSSAVLTPNNDLHIIGGLTCDNSGTCASLATLHHFAFIQQLSGNWTGEGSMINPRIDFTTTLLPTGKFLVAGGAANISGTNVLNSSEIFDPVAKTFTATGSMNVARDFHSATLMVNGRVLAAGGFAATSQSSATTKTAEIYYPDTGLWALTGNMNASRENHTATLLPNGAILVAGGYDTNSGQYLSSSEIYYSTMGVWSPTGSMASARGLHTATLLQNGMVLVVGGVNNQGVMGATEIYNPNTGTWSAGPPLPSGTALFEHTATLLQDGKVLVAGGDTGTGESAASFLYDPIANSWSTTGALNQASCSGVPCGQARFNHTATLLPDGIVMVAGGAQINNNTINSVETFNEDAQGWNVINNLTTNRAYQTAVVSPDGNVHLIGGSNGSTPLSSAEYLYFTAVPDATSGTSSSLRQSSVTAVTPALFDRSTAITVTGSNFEGATEGSGGGFGTMSSFFYEPQLYLQSANASGGSSSQGDSGFTIDLTTAIYANPAIYGSPSPDQLWQIANTSITLQMPAGCAALPYGWYNLRTESNAQFSNSTLVQAGPPKPTAAPTNLTGNVVSASTVVWTWTAPTGNFNGYDIFSATGGLFITTMPASATSFIQTGLNPSATAQILVAAYTLSGDGPGAISAAQYTTPAQPTGLFISSVSAQSVSLSWNANNNNPSTIYEVSESSDDFVSSFSTPIPTSIDLTSTSVTVNLLSPNTLYYFRVRAENLGGQFSPFSNIVSTDTRVTVFTITGAPCATNGTTCIQWSWAPPGGTVNYYNIYTATSGVLIATPTTAGFSEVGLATNTAASIQIDAVTPQGLGSLTPSATVYTLAATPSASSPPIISSGTESFTGQWSANGNPFGTQYNMDVYVNNSTSVITITQVSGVPLSAGFTGFSQAATTFTASVAAVNQVGVVSPFLVLGTSSTLANAPANLTVTNISANAISVAWNNSNNSSLAVYQVTYSTSPTLNSAGDFASGTIALPFSAKLNGSTFTITGLQSTSLYYIHALAENLYGALDAAGFSNEVSAQPFNGNAPAGSLGGTLVAGQNNVLQGTLSNGVSVVLTVPAGAVTSNVNVIISSITTTPSPCGPTGTSIGAFVQTDPPVEPLTPYLLTLSYAPSQITFPVAEASIMRVDSSGNCIPLATTPDTVHDLLTASVNHFSQFQVVQVVPNTSVDSALIFPNPFYPSRGNGYVTFSNLPANADVRVFTLRGELVAQGDADGSGVFIWNGTNKSGRQVASGIYLAAVEGDGSEKTYKVVVLR